jgi:LacI family transcriptional regulator
MKKFTIKDIARLANVSTATVSRVINNYPFIHKKTRKKVQDIILQVDYQPNATARSLATNKSRMIGVIVWDLGSLFFSEIVVFPR